MAHTPHTWNNGDVVSAAILNALEQDLAAAATSADVAALIGAAPNTLNTMQELAAAIGNDPTYAADLATQLAAKTSPADVDAKIATQAASDATTYETQAHAAANYAALPTYHLWRFGAKFDGKVYNGASITAGQTLLTVTNGTFTSADVGKTIQVLGAAASGGNLVTTIASYVSATQVNLTVAASTTVTAARTVNDGVITGGSSTITSATAAFTASDLGKYINITLGGLTIANARIFAVTSATTVSVIATPKTTGTGATFAITGGEVAYGTDDTAAWQAAQAALDAYPGGGTIVLPAGVSIVNGQISAHGGLTTTSTYGRGFLSNKRGGARYKGEGVHASRVRSVSSATLFYCSDSTSNKESFVFEDLWLEGPGAKVAGSRAIFNNTGGEYHYHRLAVSGFETGIQFYDTTWGIADLLRIEHCTTGIAFGWQSDIHDINADTRHCEVGYLIGATDGTHTTQTLSENSILFRNGDISYNVLGWKMYDWSTTGVKFLGTYSEGNLKEGEVGDVGQTTGNQGTIVGLELDGCWWDPQVNSVPVTTPAIEVFARAQVTFRNCATADNAWVTFLKIRDDIEGFGARLLWEQNNITATTAAVAYSTRSYNPGFNRLAFNTPETFVAPIDGGNFGSNPMREMQATGASGKTFERWTRRVGSDNSVAQQIDVYDLGGVLRIGGTGTTPGFISVTSVSALPTAGVNYRGVIAYVPGNGTSTGDATYLCRLTATGTYSWDLITTGTPAAVGTYDRRAASARLTETGIQAETFPRWVVGTGSVATVGTAYASRISLQAGSYTTLSFNIVSAAGSDTTNWYFGIYDATTGAQIAATADVATTYRSTTGFKTVSLPATIATAGDFYVVMLVGTATTAPNLSNGGTGPSTLLATAPAVATYHTPLSQTALPTTFNPVTPSGASGVRLFWYRYE